MEILKRDSLIEGGFAGLKEHRLVKDPKIFGTKENNDGSWSGLANFVFLADARYMPYGETHMHSHQELDIVSVIIEGRIAHQGSLKHGTDLSRNDVQVQRAGGEGFSHNEINPDPDWNRMIQIWVLPEVAGQAADYKLYKPAAGETTRIYGGENNSDTDFPAKTIIDVALLSNGQQIEVDGSYLIYITRGKGIANNESVEDGDLIRGNTIKFEATDDVQIIVVHTG